MKYSEIELETLKSTARDLEKEVEHLQKILNKKNSKHSQTLAVLESKIQDLEDSSKKVKTISDIPGRKTPKWYVVDIDFDYGATAPKFNSVQITAEGPFICTQMQPYYLVLDSTVAHYQDPIANTPSPGLSPLAFGRYIPCTATSIIGTNIVNLAQYAPTGNVSTTSNQIGPVRDFPEFSFRIEVGGSGVFWTQDKTVPAAAFYGVKEPLYLGIEGYAERTDRLIVHAVPNSSVSLTGRVRMVFHGFQIAGDVNVSEMLGY